MTWMANLNTDMDMDNEESRPINGLGFDDRTPVILHLDPSDLIIARTLDFIRHILGPEEIFSAKYCRECDHTIKMMQADHDNNLSDTSSDAYRCDPYGRSTCGTKGAEMEKDSVGDFDFVECCQLCILPILILPDHSQEEPKANLPKLYYAGLCTVSRQMIKWASRLNTQDKLESLLGFQETCLKAYAQVSSWTKFCEVDLPCCFKDLEALPENYNKNLAPDNICFRTMLPYPLLQLENEFSVAKNVPNKKKYLGKNRRKWLSELSLNSFGLVYDCRALDKGIIVYSNGKNIEGEKERLKVFDGKSSNFKDRTRDGEQMDITQDNEEWCPYLCGFNMTVADLLVFGMVSQLLSKLHSIMDSVNLNVLLPKTIRWLHIMYSNSEISKALKKSGLPFPPFEFTGSSYYGSKISTVVSSHQPITANVIEPISSKRKCEKTKAYVQVQLQAEVEKIIRKLCSKGIVPSFDEFVTEAGTLDWKSLPKDLDPAEGDLNADRAKRKRDQVQNIVFAVRKVVKPGDRIVDFCAGGGHVAIVLAYFLPSCTVVMVENKELSVSRAVNRIRRLGLSNMVICHCNLDYFKGHFDVGVTLHACGVATDLVLNACLCERSGYEYKQKFQQQASEEAIRTYEEAIRTYEEAIRYSENRAMTQFRLRARLRLLRQGCCSQIKRYTAAAVVSRAQIRVKGGKTNTWIALYKV